MVDRMHPYDNQEHRHRHTDAVQTQGLAIVRELLGVEVLPAAGVRYDLSFFSGGIGVLDEVAISLPADDQLWQTVSRFLHLKTGEEAAKHVEWMESLTWLLTSQEDLIALLPAAAQFINRQRRDFQTVCEPTSRMLFCDESDVNDWTVVWGDHSMLNYLGYSQG